MRQHLRNTWPAQALRRARAAICRGARPLDLSADVDLHPLASSLQGGERPVLLRVTLARCRHLNWLAFACTAQSASPFVQTLLAYARGQCSGYHGSPLERFYAEFRPANAAQAMGLDEAQAPRLARLPAAATPWPWQACMPAERAAQRPAQLAQDNREHGARFGAAEGDTFYGPVSARKGELEYRRLVSVYESIRSQGLRVDARGANNIRVSCLYREDLEQWRFIVAGGGQHRLAALAALAHETAIVQLAAGAIVRRCDAEHWPAVRRGELSTQQALDIFDRLFFARAPGTKR